MLPYFENQQIPLPHIPDDLSLAQFMLEHQHSIRPERGSIPCLVDSATSREISLDELRSRTRNLATAFQHRYRIGELLIVLELSRV